MKLPTYAASVLLILDGWGEAPYSPYNAVKLAKTPHLDYIKKHSFHTFLEASGEAVGLPAGAIGNSEVGHLNIGAGKVVLQQVLRINTDIISGKFFTNLTLLQAIQHAKEQKKGIHLMGLMSDALVHSSIKHLFALLKMCADNDLHENVYIHVFTDGRDTPVDASYKYITQIQDAINLYHTGTIASVSGRYYAMDRDQRWERTQKAYEAIIAQENATPYYSSALEGIRDAFNTGLTDEFILPFRIKIDTQDRLKGLIKDDDTVIFFNFREDRARQLTHACIDVEFAEFPRPDISPYFVSMVEYEKGLGKHIVYNKEVVASPLSQVIADKNFFQCKVAETEKYAHVTYFFNGERETEMPQEDRYLIPSLKIPTYDLAPQMRVFEITQTLIEKIKTEKYKLLVANFANADMVGHTGNLQATIAACEHIDSCIGKILEAIEGRNICLFTTADHGNAEIKYYEDTKEISTAHTINPVPLYIYASDLQKERLLEKGKLADIAPTILARLGIDRSYDMSGINLLD